VPGRPGVGTNPEQLVNLCLADGAYFLKARLNVTLPGVERETAQSLA
jgi:organic hydroperoxide reductase OsmC/OhrA